MYRFRPLHIALCALVFASVSHFSMAATLCVNPAGSKNCYKTIQDAVNHASANDLIEVGAGTYTEEVTVGIPVSIVGAGAYASIIDATNLAHGIFVDGYDHPGLNNVVIRGFTVENAQFEGILLVSASDVTVNFNHIVNNDKSSGLQFTGALTGCPNQPGNGIYENDETGDCGGGLHLVGVANSTVSDNLISGNADGLLISDETAESRNNLVIHNIVRDNPFECGIVMASHPPANHTTPPFPPHHGVDNNSIMDNVSDNNGLQGFGSGVGMFSDGAGQGRVSGNVVANNKLNHNGLGGVALHTHVGPAFGLPADNMSGNKIIGNEISGNLADEDDTATPGRVGININSGGGGSPVRGTVISHNVIRDEDVDVAVNTPAEVDVHLNDLLGGKVGVADVYAFDGATACTGKIDATQNYWGCAAGPGNTGCSTIDATGALYIPWLQKPIEP